MTLTRIFSPVYANLFLDLEDDSLNFEFRRKLTTTFPTNRRLSRPKVPDPKLIRDSSRGKLNNLAKKSQGKKSTEIRSQAAQKTKISFLSTRIFKITFSESLNSEQCMAAGIATELTGTSRRLTSEDERSCLGNTVHNYFYGPEGQTINPNHNPVVSQQQGKPGKVGPRGDRGFRGQKGTKGEPGQRDNTFRELERMQSELRALKERLETISAPSSSCDHIQDKESSGTYLISPEPSKVQPFFVFCNFTAAESGMKEFIRPTKSEKLIKCQTPPNYILETVIEHDTMEEVAVPKCKARKCYRRKISYNVDMDQIVALINRSSHCRQYIKYRCRASVIFNGNSEDYASWVSRDGTQMHYWGGATSQRNDYCACGETGNCVDPSQKCNCDRNTAPETSDEGYLTDKDALPVTGLFFGDTDGSAEFGWHTLGPLICTGRS
ncbi:unnamed protein product [Clavelina lepadiformis]|uniref:Uncharacterized protein n=1 Tax=Clavelina lepadiformis TaxID=159417 RepID=A0ABP0F5Q1_CLALP